MAMSYIWSGLVILSFRWGFFHGNLSAVAAAALDGAQSALAAAGIKLYGGVSGQADQAVEAFAAGKLDYDPNVHCDHHGEHHHGEGHQCGEHGCGGEHHCH